MKNVFIFSKILNKEKQMKILPRYTLRIPQTLLKKINYTAQFNGRSKNKEIETAIKRYINDFERLHGDIEISEDFDE